MANKLISMEKLRQIIRLKQDGYSSRKISQVLGLHRETVGRYVAQLMELGLSADMLLKEEDSVLNSLLRSPNS